jgi:hypothetical protein
LVVTIQTNKRKLKDRCTYGSNGKGIECNLGIDSTDEEKAKAKQQQLIYLSQNKRIRP